MLLVRLEEAISGSSGAAGEGGGYTPLLPSTWDRSYRELWRCLELLADVEPRAYRHLKARYVHAPRRIRRDVRFRGGRYEGLGPRSQVLVGPDPVRQRLERKIGASAVDVVVLEWPAWVDPLAVDDALAFLDAAFQGEPMLPYEFIGG